MCRTNNRIGVLCVDGKVVAEQKTERTILLIVRRDESLEIGADTSTPADEKKLIEAPCNSKTSG